MSLTSAKYCTFLHTLHRTTYNNCNTLHTQSATKTFNKLSATKPQTRKDRPKSLLEHTAVPVTSHSCSVLIQVQY